MPTRRSFIKQSSFAAAGLALTNNNSWFKEKDLIGLQLYTLRSEIVKDLEGTIAKVASIPHGTLDGLKVIKVLGCVNSAPEFIEQHLVINGASDLFHEIFGKTGDGYHARSALGFASLPTGAAVEVEAIFEIK